MQGPLCGEHVPPPCIFDVCMEHGRPILPSLHEPDTWCDGWATHQVPIPTCQIVRGGRDIMSLDKIMRISSLRDLCNHMLEVVISCFDCDFQAVQECTLANSWISSEDETPKKVKPSARALASLRKDILRDSTERMRLLHPSCIGDIEKLRSLHETFLLVCLYGKINSGHTYPVGDNTAERHSSFA